ncbi:hypothetical protein [Pseudomonas sp. MYb185]|uniref:hypothetical protein n=1 Tax=Pseudomonas sp. MYb185 TaxID=1848729 RepID=UPI000CFB9C95|nr:hypothetical protein [Pseudomonas sp. MYb185]PRB80541.1 hypothetical protein CQ007_12545 [Pseudomonas sp. MYb185]
MEKFLEFCQSRYQDELEQRLTLSNIICWGIFILSWHSLYKLKSPSLICALNQINVKYITDLDAGIIPMLTISELAISILFTASILWLSKKISAGLFYLFTLKGDFGKLIIDITNKFNSNTSPDLLEKNALPHLEKNQKKLRRSRSLSTIALALSACALLNLSFNLENLTLTFLGLLFFIVNTWRSFHFFIEEVLPYFIAAKYTTGEISDIYDSYNASC